VHDQSAVTTYLFTDIEGSTRLWETEPDKMRRALARHDAIIRACVESNHGTVVKMSGDGVHAVFADPLDALQAALELQRKLGEPAAIEDLSLQVRCGVHTGVDERRDNDFFGGAVNRASRIMSAAYGGQILLSQVVATLIGNRLPIGVALRDLGHVRLRSLTTPERIYQAVHPQLRHDFPPLHSLEVTPNNLPQQLSSFVGRERELADIRRRLADTRLLTLTGAGGLGKTRLSLEVAAQVLDEYPDGAWFVDLAPVADERLVPQAVASVLGVKEELGHPVLEALIKYTRERKLLLILDNCEHLLQACAHICLQLLQTSPDLRVLASSREHLHIVGEKTYPVPPLMVPSPDAGISVEALMRCEGIRLFADRASAAQRAFQVTPSNAKALAEICQRLDGIPLAIELAAARVRALSVKDIASRLSDRFALLTRGERGALPRQQTLRALIDWSYDLLTKAEQSLFGRLSVFAGGWSLEAAEAVGASDDLKKAQVLDLLTNLVEKSLVMLEPQGGRYRLLETVRQYAQERLEQSGERAEVCTRHLDFYLTFAEKARPKLFGPDQAEWLKRLDLDRENLLSAHVWCNTADDGAKRGLKLVDFVMPYWFNRGLLGLGHRITVEAIARSGAKVHDIERCRGLFDAGQLCCFMGRYAEAQGYLEESLSLARELGENRRIAMTLQPLGLACLGQADVATARKHLEEALQLAKTLGDNRELAGALNGLAQLHRVNGALDLSEPMYEQVLALARDLGDRESTAIALLNLAMVAVARQSTGRARDILLDVIAIVDEIGSMRGGQSVIEVCAGLAVVRREWEEAARLFGAAEEQTEATGLRRDPGDEAFLMPLIAEARKALGVAVFRAAEEAGRRMSYTDAMTMSRTWLESAP
jgi:predicted ATPase/class 3 adenylate cyclase